MNLFGTDGIRGKVDSRLLGPEEAIEALLEHRRISPTLAWLVASAAARLMDGQSPSSMAVVGWDERPGNALLVDAVTHALRSNGWKVEHLGPCATPLVHHMVARRSAALGIMVTASHNPVEDSGLKLFDGAGRKTGPSLERRLSDLVVTLAQEDHPLADLPEEALTRPDSILEDPVSIHAEWLDRRLEVFKRHFPHRGGGLHVNGDSPLLLDSSRGTARHWLADWLSEHGCPCREVSHEARALNEGCGAGEITPGQAWTWEEAASSDHLLLRSARPVEEGHVVGAALDGDGDRCLFLQSTADGLAVVDGDAMALALLLAADTSHPWTLAASIESDLGLNTKAAGMTHVGRVVPTAVGDRWLSVALAEAQTVGAIGVEDSGHLVLSWSLEEGGKTWLVGDGAASLVAVLVAGLGRNAVPLPGGWKQRRSVAPSVRSRWTGEGPLTERVLATVQHHLPEATDLRYGGLEHEPDLFRVEGRLDDACFSLGIRNSGTQAKTSISVRTDDPNLANEMEGLMTAVEAVLRPVLSP